jgi:hypothetical protein
MGMSLRTPPTIFFGEEGQLSFRIVQGFAAGVSKMGLFIMQAKKPKPVLIFYISYCSVKRKARRTFLH